MHHREKRLSYGMTAIEAKLMQHVAYCLSIDRVTPHPSNLCSNADRTSVYFPMSPCGFDAENMHSTSLVNHGEACSEWILSS